MGIDLVHFSLSTLALPGFHIPCRMIRMVFFWSFFLPHFKVWQHTGISTDFYLCQAITCNVIDAELLFWSSPWLCKWPWFITEPHCIAASLESIRLNCTKTQTRCTPSCCSRWPITSFAPPGKSKTAMGGNIPKSGLLSMNQYFQKQIFCSKTENL